MTKAEKRRLRMVRQAESGALSAAKVRDIADALVSGAAAEATYTDLLVLGLAAGPQYASTVEPYLSARHGVDVVRMALDVLCNYWGLTEMYKTHVMAFAEGVPWDDEEHSLQCAALRICGEYLRDRRSDDAVFHLIEKAARGHPGDSVALAARRALGRASGGNWCDILVGESE